MKILDNVEKICSFSVNDWHLAVMLLPHIKEHLEKNNEVNVFFQENFEEKINTLLEKLNLKEDMKNKLKNINWNNNEFDCLRDNNNVKKIIFVYGSINYIRNIDLQIENIASENKDITYKIVNCFNTNEIGNNTLGILREHSKVLNTVGLINSKEYIG